MSTPESAPTRTQRVRVSLFRVLGGTFLTFAVLGLTCLGVGIYYTSKESSTSGWFSALALWCLGGSGWPDGGHRHSSASGQVCR
jgi:hypothetical protein